jgi:hypothetical protein
VTSILDNDIGTRVGENNVEGFLGSASVVWSTVDVGDEHIRKSVEDIVRRTGTADGDWSTVHVHFTVTDSVEPGPDKDGFTSLETIWKHNGDFGETVGWVSAGEVSVGIDWACTFVRLNNLEDGVLGWWVVVGDRDLTRTTAVDSATDQLEST